MRSILKQIDDLRQQIHSLVQQVKTVEDVRGNEVGIGDLIAVAANKDTFRFYLVRDITYEDVGLAVLRPRIVVQAEGDPDHTYTLYDNRILLVARAVDPPSPHQLSSPGRNSL